MTRCQQNLKVFLLPCVLRSTPVVIKTREGEDSNSGSGAAPPVQEREVADRETEVSHLLDSHLVWPEFLEGACRIAAAAMLLQQQLDDGPDVASQPPELHRSIRSFWTTLI